MDGGSSKVKLPILDGVNYGYWKSKIQSYICGLDSRAWIYVENEWVHPTKVVKGKGTDKTEEVQELKPRKDWTDEEHREATLNSKALFAICSAVDNQEFKKISKCTTAYKAWQILQAAHEGTETVKDNKLLIITTKFDNLRMSDDETIKDFHDKLADLSNQAFALGKVFSEKKLVKKILRSLPKKFKMITTALKQANDIKTMTVEHLIGSLQAYEQELSEDEEEIIKKGKKNLAFKSTANNDSSNAQDRDFQEHMILLSKNINRFLNSQGGNNGESK